MRQAAHLEKMLMEEGAEIPRIAVLSSFTADFLAPYILVESSNMGYPQTLDRPVQPVRAAGTRRFVTLMEMLA